MENMEKEKCTEKIQESSQKGRQENERKGMNNG